MTTKAGLAQKAVRIPISNIPGGGDYTAQIHVGSQNIPANVILDTGSSTLAVKHSVYKPTADKNLKATKYAQDVSYGTGGWAGPVVITSISMGTAGSNVTLQNSPMAIADDQQAHNFGAADGNPGLACSALNNAFDLAPVLQQRNINPAVCPIHILAGGYSSREPGRVPNCPEPRTAVYSGLAFDEQLLHRV